MHSHLEALAKKHSQLAAELEDEAVLSRSSPAEIAAKSKQMASLQGAARLKQQWDSLVGALEEARQVLSECDVGTREGREMAALGACGMLAQLAC
jgi:hypothetical protein